MTQWTRRERLEATIAGEQADRPPVALWRHFPIDDQYPDQLAASTVEFQRQYDWDFIKVTPASSFCVCDWEVEDWWVGNEEGTRDYTHHPIQTPEQWFELEPLDPERGALGAQLRCLQLVQEAVGEDVPFIQTVFNPLSQAKGLVGRENLVAQLRQAPDAVHAALETITETTASFIAAARKRRISGIFLAVQHASYDLLCESEYEAFGIPYDQRLLEAASGLWLNVLHLHGQQVMFDLLADYAVQVVNWHDRETPPSLRQGQNRFGGTVLGGLRQWETMAQGTPAEVDSEAKDAIAQTDGHRFILGTGCVTPITAPWANLRAARVAVE
jgi:uroporphyrinogen decarboxylase